MTGTPGGLARRRGRVLVPSLLATLLAIQFIRPGLPQGEPSGNGRINDVAAVPPDIDSLLRRSCYDCHSDQTDWPWYSHVAPISWLVVRDVRHGRADLDLSRWSVDPVREPTPEQRFRWICQDVRRGIMPPRLYLMAHPGARLGEADVARLCAWAEQQLAALASQR